MTEFNPASLFGVGSRGFLYDFSDYSAQFTDTAGTAQVSGTGQAVARVNDKSGLGNNATQATLGNRPLTTTIGTGYRGIQFDGTDDWLQTAAIDFSNSDEVTIVAGVRKLSDAARGMVVEGTGSAGVFRFEAPVSASATYGMGHQGANTTAVSAAQSGFASPITSVVTGLLDLGAPLARLRVNGSQVQTNNAATGGGNFASSIIYIGRRSGTTLPYNGVITFLMAINRLLTASEIAQVEAYANARTGAVSTSGTAFGTLPLAGIGAGEVQHSLSGAGLLPLTGGGSGISQHNISGGGVLPLAGGGNGFARTIRVATPRESANGGTLGRG